MPGETSQPRSAVKPNKSQRPHVCRFCRKAFVRAEHLQRHVASHENKRPYVCGNCCASFGRADVLRRHERKCPDANQQRLKKRDDHRNHHGNARSNAQRSTVPDELATEFITTLTAAACFCNADSVKSVDTRLQSEQSVGSATPTNIPPQTSITSLSDELDCAVSTCSTSSCPHRAQHLRNSTEDGGQVVFHDGGGPFNRTGGLMPPTPFSIAQIQSDLADPVSQIFEPMLQDDTFVDLPIFDAADYIFLEESLLPGFCDDFPSRSLPELSSEAIAHQSEFQNDTDILASRTRNVTPKPWPSYAPEPGPDFQISRQKFYSIRCGDEDAMIIRLAFNEARTLGANIEPGALTRARISRLLNAYYEYFDPHTPIVHRPTFCISSTPPTLLLAMLAIGGCYLSEHDLASKAYESCCRLISKHECDLLRESTFELWLIQATLLCVQFGIFSENTNYYRQSQRHLAFVTDLLRAAEMGKSHAEDVSSDWQRWLYTETLTRLACWSCVLSGVILVLDPQTTCVSAHQELTELPMPSNDSLWRAGTSATWSHSKQHQPYPSLKIFNVFKMMVRGETPSISLSPFGMISLVGAMLSYLCSHERHSLTATAPLSGEVISSIERSLRVWETVWRQHPLAERLPSRCGDPLMADCLSLLGSTYYHLYMGPELQVLKRIANDAKSDLLFPPLRLQRQVLKAIKYAASSWLVRAKMGIAHLQRTAALDFGGHVLVTAYESALVLSWWLNAASDPRNKIPTDDAEYSEILDAIDCLFQDIFEEVGDQGVCCDFSKVKPASTPLVFYRMLMQRWVWTYSSSLAQNLANFAARLDASDPWAPVR